MVMRVAAIINFWDGHELLPHAVENWFRSVDDVIIVYSNASNFGEVLDNTRFLSSATFKKCTIVPCEPIAGMPAMENERRKRNHGINTARSMGIPYIIPADADEFYDAQDVARESKRFENPSLGGLVCASQVYFKDPTLTIGIDITLVPFIHRLTPSLTHGFNTRYPYAFINRQIRIDPTRQFNIVSGVEWSETIMHHMSWVRASVDSKVNNSSARVNIAVSSIRDDFAVAADGVFIKFYGCKLVKVPNRFNIPSHEDMVQNLRRGAKPLATTNTPSQP